MSDRFRKFLEHIIEDGEWEYDDGPNMTEDARQFLEYHDRLRSELVEARARLVKSQAREAALREAAKDVQSHERDPDKGVISLGLRDNKNSREALNRLFILASTPGPSLAKIRAGVLENLVDQVRRGVYGGGKMIHPEAFARTLEDKAARLRAGKDGD